MVKERRISGKVTAWMVAIAIILSITSFLPIAVTAQSTAVVSIPNASANTSETVIVPINITNVTHLGAVKIQLSYDNSVVIVDSVASGDMGSVTAGINNTAGMTTMNCFSATGVSDDIVFAYVTLNATGSADNISPLNLTVLKLENTSFTSIERTEDDGVFTVETGPVPLAAEAGGPYSGLVDQSITLTGSATGGTSPYSYAWDLDNDSEYDDATGATTLYTWSTADTYTIGLQVTDSAANVSTDTATVGVSEIVGALVSIQDASADTGKNVTVPINITNVTDLGAVNIQLSYDTSVVIVDSVASGDMGSVTAGINNTAGVTTMNCFSATGVSGDIVFAYVSLNATGSADNISPLNLTVLKLENTSFTSIERTEDDGVFTVRVEVAPEVAINEFMSDNATEWVELFNNGSSDVNLTGWTLEDEKGNSKSLSGLGTIAADGYKVFTSPSGWLNNGGDVIWLNSTENIDRVGYETSGDAPAPDAGNSTGRYPNGVDTDNDAADFVVFDTPTPGETNVPITEQPDLIVTEIEPKCGYLFANESNNITATVKNNGSADANAFNVSFAAADDFSDKVSVSELAAGATTTVYAIDNSIRDAGATVTITVTADCDDTISESNEGNNATTLNMTVVNNGYKGKRYTGGANMTTWKTFELNGNLTYSLGDSYYLSAYTYSNWTTYIVNWTASDLSVPGTATIREARLYVPYTWDKADVMPDEVNLTFNDETQTLDKHYSDRKGYGSYNYPYGMLAYNVTADFDASSNTAVLTNSHPGGNNVSMRGMVLVVVYADESEPTRTIYMNEDFDMLYGGSGKCTTPAEATAYAPFSGMTIEDIDNITSAKLITVAPGAGPNEGELIFNDHTWDDVWNFTTDAQIGIDERDVTTYLQATDNEAGFQSSADYMEASNAILMVEYVSPPVLKNITVSPATVTLNVSEIQVFTATAKDKNGEPMSSINITWTSSNETVGNVSPSWDITDENGNATTTFTAGSVAGTTMVNATNGTIVRTAEVNVTSACGDVAPYPGGNEKVDMGDVVLLLNHVGNTTEFPVNERAGDVKCTGTIDMGDVVLLLNHVGNPDEFPLECC